VERIQPSTLTGPRAFFTAFDHRIVDRSANLDELQRDCERKLKLLLLLKSQVVCSATHLKSTVAWRIFSKYPFLLYDRHVLPALQEVKPKITDAFKAAPDVEKFYEEHVSAVVDWELVDNSAWFRDRFIEVLQDPQSLLRLQAPAISDSMVEEFVARHVQCRTLGREAVRNWAEGLPEEQFYVTLAFRELLYHVSGARVVNCEGALPQEDYVDYDIADLSQQRTRLSEEMVFMKIYIELVRDEMCQRPIPVDVIDLLEFEDVISLRAPLTDSGFQARYDELCQAALVMVRGEGGPLVENVQCLDKIRASLSDTFREILESEVARFAAKRRIEGGAFASAGASVALGLASLVPGLGPAATAAALSKDGTSIFFNIARFSRQPRRLHERVEARDRAIRNLAKRGVAADMVMVDAVRLLTDAISSRLRL
jgi:hypothetical protein